MTSHNRTLFGDLRSRAVAVYRVTTQSSVYLVGVHHDEAGKQHVVVHGQDAAGATVVVRDTDPKVGGRRLFDVPASDWTGKILEVATMRSTPIESVVFETDSAALAAVGGPAEPARSPWARPTAAPPDARPAVDPQRTLVDPRPPAYSPHAPPHLAENPRIVPQPAKGTLPFDQALAARLAPAAKAVVVGAAPVKAVATTAPIEPELPYPMRHLHYAESVVQLIRSLARRERVFEDLGNASPAYRERLRAALDECALLLETIRRRDR